MRARDFGHQALRRLGVDLVRYNATNFTGRRRMEELTTRRIGLVLDVGANAGQFALGLRREGFRGRIVSFEPLRTAYAELVRLAVSDPLWETQNLALGDRDGEATIQVAENSWSSSLLPIADRHVASAPASRTVATETVRTAQLDSLADELLRGDRAYLKLDVQGAELLVLHGAERVLAEIDVVEAELSIVELYEGQPLLSEVVSFLADRGLVLVQLEPEFLDPDTGALLQLNGIFVRP
jgi:FkbM family methyltransferase